MDELIFQAAIKDCLLSKYDGRASGWFETTYYADSEGTESYAARAGDTMIEYSTALEFSTDDFGFSEITSIELRMTGTARKDSNGEWKKYFSPINVSAILCDGTGGIIDTKELYGTNSLESNDIDTQLASLLGTQYIGCALSGESEASLRNYLWRFDLKDKSQALKPNTKYYIYLKRKVTLDSGAPSGFICFQNPLNSPSGYSLTLQGSSISLEDLPKPENFKLSPSFIDFSELVNGTQSFEICDVESGIPLTEEELQTFGSINWIYHATDPFGAAVMPEGMTLSNGVFTYDKSYEFLGKVEIIASWGNNFYQLKAAIDFPWKWEGLKAWLTGVVMERMSVPMLINAPTYYRLGRHVVRPFPTYNQFNNNYAYLAIDTAYQDSYVYYISSQPLLYNQEADTFSVQQRSGTQLVYSTSRGGRMWSEFKQFETDLETFFLMPIWTSKNVGIKYFDPILIYN